jgi:hypothetical protein
MSFFGIRALWILALSITVAGCEDGSRIADLRNADGARRDQEDCLRTNAGYFTGQAGDPYELGRTIAAACRDKTNSLATYAIPHISPSELARYQAEAEQRAAGYVLRGRGES